MSSSEGDARAMSFRAQLSIAMGALLVILVSFVGAYFPARLEREAIVLISYKMRALLDLTAFTIDPAVYLGDTDALSEALTGTTRDEDVVYVIVAGPNGVLARIHGERASPAALRRTVDGATISEDGSMFEGMTTIVDGERTIARLYVGMSLERLRREIRNARVAIGAVSALLLAFGIVAVIGTSTYLTRPLQEVAAAAESIASGNKRERVRSRGTAEVRRLSSSFNTMLEEMELRAQELQRSHDELRRLSRKLLSVQEEERVTISREVHDEVGQALTVLKMDVQNLPPARLDPAAARHLSDSIDSLIELVRRIATELRPLVLDDLGLRAAIEQQIRRLTEKTGIHVSLEAPETLNIDRFTASTILRIVQEALSNVVRHSGATAAEVRLTFENALVRAEIRDNGLGIDPAKATAPESLGLLGIRERALLLGGQAFITSDPRGGTLVRVVIPAAASPTEQR